MNKSILIFVVSLGLSFQKDAGPKISMLFNDDLEVLNGNVKQLIELSEDHHSDLWAIRRDTTNFDRNANANATIRAGGMIKYIFKWNIHGKKTEVIADSKNGKMIYNYNQKGDVTQSSQYYPPNELFTKTAYRYGASRHLVEQKIFEPSNKSSRIFRYKYNNRGFLIEKSFFNGQQELEFKTKYLYKSIDKQNNWTKLVTISRGFNHFAFVDQADTIYRKITYY